MGLAGFYFFPAARTGLSGVAHSSLPDPAVGGLPAAVGRLAAAGLVFLAAWALGSLILRLPMLRDAEPGGSRERTLAALGLGLAGLSVIALVLSPLGLLRAWALVAVVATLGVAGIVAIAGAGRGPHPAATPRPAVGRPRGALEIALACAIVAGAGFALIAALAPEVEYDALWYHLDLPRRALDSGSLVSDRCEYVSFYPMGAELLYAYGLALGDAVIAKLVSCGVYLAFVFATYDLGARVGSRRTALVAAAIAALTPSVLWEGTTTYVDVMVGLFLTLSLSSTLRHAESGRLAPLALAGLLGGFALAVKALALIGIAAIALVVIAGRRSPLRAKAGSLALFGGLALVPALPWLVRAQVEAGNPVFPSLYGVFGADDSLWTRSAADAYESALDRIGHVDGFTGLLKLPWDITMHSSRFAGCIGVLFLMLVPLAFARRSSRLLAMVGLFAAAYVVLWASPPSSQQLRFLIPVVPALAVVAAHGLEAARGLAAGLHPRASGVPAVVVVATLALSIPAFTAMHDRDGELTLTHVLRGAPADVVTGAESEARYLTRKLPAYGAAQRLRKGGRVVALTDPYVNFYAAPALIPDWSACITLAGARAGDSRSELRALRRLGANRLLVEPGIRTEQGALAVVRKPPPAGTARVVYRDGRAVVYRLLPAR